MLTLFTSFAIFNNIAVSLPLLNLQDIEDLLSKSRLLENGTAPLTTMSVDGNIQKYSAFSILDQKRASIMLDIARMAQHPQQRELYGPPGSCSQSISVTLRAVQYVLSHTWNPSDLFCRELINGQIEMHFHLAGSLVDRLATLKIEEHMEEEYDRECDDALANVSDANHSDTLLQDQECKGLVPDPRALGLTSKYATEDMKVIKRLILLSISKALHLAVIINDEIGIQNAIIHFWNLHLHIFRRKLTSIAMLEVLDFLKISNQIIQSLQIQSSTLRSGTTITTNEKSKPMPKGSKLSPRVAVSVASQDYIITPLAIDEKLTLSMVEALVEYLERKGDYQDALTTAMNALSIDLGYGNSDCMIIIVPFLRRKLCESAARCAGRLSLKPGAAAVSALSVAAAVNGLKFDNVLMTIYAALSLAEMPSTMTSNEIVLAAVEKATRLMDVEVAALLLSIKWGTVSQDEYDQVMEMQAEILSRIVRLNISSGDIRGAQLTAVKCLSLVDSGTERGQQKALTDPNAMTLPSYPDGKPFCQKLSPRVWRWISVCERLLGLAICGVIQDEGQDEILKRELRVASLRHYALACTYGTRAQRVELIIEAASNGWNVMRVALESRSSDRTAVDGEIKKNVILNLQFQILESLLGCKEEAGTIVGALSALSVLLQQMYVSMVTQLADSLEWTKASNLVMEAFQHVPGAMQKPLWRLRVIIMSKQGKNVLDGIQKMIAGDGKKDLALQARVYSILARASSTGRQQLDAYRKTIELLSGDPGRVDYILEIAQWMSSYGLSRPALNDMLLSAMDALYELEKNYLIPPEDGGKDDSSMSCSSTARSKSGPSARGVAATPRGGSVSNRTVKSSRSGSQTRRKSFSKIFEADQLQGLQVLSGLDAKQCEQAVRTSFMLALLQGDESLRLERLLEGVYFVGRSIDLWTASLKVIEKGLQWALLSIEEKETYPIYADFTPTTLGKSSTLLQIPSDSISLLSWTPSPLFLELHSLCSVQSPMKVPSAISFVLLPLTVHYLLWAADELHSLGHQKHSLLLLGWLRAILLVIPMQKKEFILAAVHYKALNILYSCGVRACDAERILPATLGATSLTPSIFLSEIGLDMMTAVLNFSVPMESQPNGFNLFSEHQNVFRVPTLTKIMGTTDSLATDIPSCLLSVCRSLKELGQIPLAQHIIGVARAYSILRSDKHITLVALTIEAEFELLQGKAREALSLLLLSKEVISNISDGILLSKIACIAAKCYSRLGARDESRRVLLDALELLDISSLKSSTSIPVGVSNLIEGQRDNALSFDYNRSVSSTDRMSMCATTTATFTSTFQKIELMTSLPSSPGLKDLEGDMECASALVEAFSTYLFLISEECSSCITMSNTNFDFIGSLAVIDNIVEIVLQKVTAVAGGTSILTARVLECAARATYSTILNMQKISNTYNGLTATDYPIWFDRTLQRVIQSTAAAVNIRRDICCRLTEKELTFEFRANATKVSDTNESTKKIGGKSATKTSGKKSANQDTSSLDVEEVLISSLLSTLQMDLSKVRMYITTSYREKLFYLYFMEDMIRLIQVFALLSSSLILISS